MTEKDKLTGLYVAARRVLRMWDCKILMVFPGNEDEFNEALQELHQKVKDCEE